MKAAGDFERSGGQRRQRSGDPVRLYGYPRGWVRGDARDRDYRQEIAERLERIEVLLERLVSNRLP